MARPSSKTKQITKPNGAESNEAKPQEIKPFPLTALKLHEFQNCTWRLNCPAGTRIEDLENPAIWGAVQDKIRPFDLIQVVCAGFWIELLVVDSEKSFPVTIAILRKTKLPLLVKQISNASGLPQGFRIDFDPLSKTYTAYRDKDNIRMTQAFHSREDCRRALVDHASLR
jgi:hypothetical protein